MNFTKKLTPMVVAGTMATSSLLTVPMVAQAGELSADVTVANMYLWRGIDASAGGPQVSGSLGWDSGAGFYVNSWASSGYQVDAGDGYSGYELDVWAGYAGEAGGISYDISVWQIMYPQGSTTDSPDGMQAGTEISLGLGYENFSVSYTTNSGERYEGEADYNYITVGAGFGDFGITIGQQDVDADDADWMHIDLSYALNDNASVTVSKASYEADDKEEDPLVVFSYTLPIDMK